MIALVCEVKVSETWINYCIVLSFEARDPLPRHPVCHTFLNNFGRRFGGTQIGPNRKKEIGKTKNHIGYQNRKTASIFYENRKPDAKTRKIRKPHWTPKPKNRSLLTQKPKNRSKKHPKPQNRKSQCPPLYNGETKNPFHEFSSKHSSNFFLCVGYFSRKNIVFVFFPHLSNLAVTIEFTELLFSTCSRYCWNYCILFFLVDVFDRKWVSVLL